MLQLFVTEGKKIFAQFPGGCGRRSRYLAHAKRALYHLSYSPNDREIHRQMQ